MLIAHGHLLKPVATGEKLALDILSTGDGEEQCVALATLGRIGTKPAFDAVLKALGTSGPPINQAAANALGGMSYPAAETSLLALLKGAPGPDQIPAIKAVTTRQLDGVTGILLEVLKGSDEPASKEAMKALWFIPTFDDLMQFCNEAISAKHEGARRTLSSLCKRIASVASRRPRRLSW